MKMLINREALLYLGMFLLVFSCEGLTGERKTDIEYGETDLAGECLNLCLDETEFSLKLVMFFATWCTHCNADMPEIIGLYETYHNRGLQVIAVSSEDRDTVTAYIELKSIPFTVLLDTARVNAGNFKVKYTPVYCILNNEGEVIRRVDGSGKTDDIETFIRENI